MPQFIALAATTASPLIDEAGNVLPGREVNAVLHTTPPTSTLVTVYPNPDGSGVPFSQPLFTSVTGEVPGYVQAQQDIDIIDVATGTRHQAELVSAEDVSAAIAAIAAETARATAAEALLAPVASPTFTGSPRAPTAAALDASTKLASTAYADAAVAVEKARGLAAEALGLAKASNLSDVADADTARANVKVPTLRHVQCVATSNQALSGALPTIDGYAVQDGDRVLLTGQTTGSQNGVWVAHTAGWARPNDYPAGGVLTSRIVGVTAGGTWASTIWELVSTASITIDTSATTWSSIGRAAGTGLTLTGNTLAVSYGTAAGTAAQGNDTRITGAEQTANKGAASGYMALDAGSRGVQSPKLHATDHQPGGADALAVDAAAGTGSLRTIGKTALKAADGADTEYAFSGWKDLAYHFGNFVEPPALAAGTYLFYPNNHILLGAAGSVNGAFYFDPADYPGGTRTTKIRFRAWVITNAVAPGINYTFGLYPIATFGGVSGVNPSVATLGAAIVTAAINAPAASSANHVEAAATAFPAAGWYSFAVVTSGATAASSATYVGGRLQAQMV